MKLNLHILRYSVGLIILIGHFLAAGVYVWKINQVPTADIWQFLNGITALAPFTLLYASVFYRYVVSNPTASHAALNTPVDPLPFAIQVIMVLSFVTCLVLAIPWSFANFDRISGIENISIVLGGIDTFFAVFVSASFAYLFPLEWEASADDSDS